MERHRNNIGVLRLVLALLVIVGHAPELIDGNRLREPLTRVFHTLSLGELAVDGFFLISGYLITQSMIRTGSLRSYLVRRSLRIYPAFIVAYLVCVYGLGWLMGAGPSVFGYRPLIEIPLLSAPQTIPPRFAQFPYPSLNGSMWTIHYEFGCYLMIAGLWLVGILSRRYWTLGLSILAAMFLVAGEMGVFPGWLGVRVEHNLPMIRLFTVFLAGACFYLFRDLVFPRLTPTVAAVATLAAMVSLYRDPWGANLGLAVFGGVALFWLCFKASLGPVQRINDKWDISYGVYLYGFPAEDLIRWYAPHISPWLLAPLAIVISVVLGVLSWYGVEKWSKDLLRSRSEAPAAAPRVVFDQPESVPTVS